MREPLQTVFDFGQRWTDRRSSFRVRGRDFDASRYSVDLLSTDRQAKTFVERHHYSGSYPAARVRAGLFEGRELVGVAVFSVPMQAAVVPKWLGCAESEGVELGRLVLLDCVPFNAETWFLRRAFSALRQEKAEIRGVVSYSDPVPRQTAAGVTVMPGHVGTIYKAFNGAYLGRGSKRTLLLDHAGRVVSARALSKLRNGERGAEYAEQVLYEAGAPGRYRGESGRSYVQRVLAAGVFRRVPHPGNHVYAWSFDRALSLVSKPFPVLPGAPHVAACR